MRFSNWIIVKSEKGYDSVEAQEGDEPGLLAWSVVLGHASW